jgi:histidinol dehydrogenase
MTKVIKVGVASTEKTKIDTEIQNTVSNIIDQIDSEGDDALRRLSTKFDKWDRQDYRLTQAEIERILNAVPESVKSDINSLKNRSESLLKHNDRHFEKSKSRRCPGCGSDTRTFP